MATGSGGAGLVAAGGGRLKLVGGDGSSIWHFLRVKYAVPDANKPFEIQAKSDVGDGTWKTLARVDSSGTGGWSSFKEENFDISAEAAAELRGNVQMRVKAISTTEASGNWWPNVEWFQFPPGLDENKYYVLRVRGYVEKAY